MQNLTQEKYWELFQKIPEELRETIASEKTAENIFNVCVANDLDLPQITGVARYTGRVLLGILLPEDFQKTIEENLHLEKDAAKNISSEIYRFVFYPVKTTLEGFLNKKEEPGKIDPGKKVAKTESILKEKKVEQKIPEPNVVSGAKDTYREPVE